MDFAEQQALRDKLASRPPTIIVDWDGTCVPSAWPEKPEEWLPGAKEGLRALVDAGYRVRIHSARTHMMGVDYGEPNDDREDSIAYIRKMLDDAGLFEVEIITDEFENKPGAIAYVDDRGLTFTGNNWNRIVATITGTAPALDFGPEFRATDPETGGSKGRKQASFAQMSVYADVEEARVHGFGLAKYPDEAMYPNWRRGMPWSWFYDALRRHVAAFWAGEDVNPESGLLHLAHARWMISALIEYHYLGLGTDDRPVIVAALRRAA